MPSTPNTQRRPTHIASPRTSHPGAHPHHPPSAEYANGSSLAASNGKGHTNGTANGHVADAIPSLYNGDPHTSSTIHKPAAPTQKHFANLAGAPNLPTSPLISPSTSNGHLFPPHAPPHAAISIKAQGKARAVDDATSSPLRRARRPSDINVGSQYVPPSRLFASPSPPPTGSGPRSISIEALKSELNFEDDAAIPLAAVVERVASEAYETLQNLGETISSLPSSSRRTRIFNTALDLRRQMIKLYVLVKWSKCAKHMQLLKNIIGLIHEQSYQTVDAREHLTETRGILPKARERNHDLVTAIDVLSTGQPQRLGPSIRDEAVPPDPISDSEARAIVHELEEAIRVRMASSETLPLPLRAASHQVSDGRVTLSAPNLFSFALTLSGAKDDDRWFLLSVVFDYKITGLGQDRFPQDLWEQQREGFIATANEVLAPKPIDVGPVEHQEEGDVGGGTGAADHSLLHGQVMADAPIVRLYNFLQSQALEYQLDILAFQVSELSRLLWRGNLNWRWQERTLVISYWTHGEAQTPSSATSVPSNGRNTPRGPMARKPRWNPTIGGILRLQVLPEETESASEKLLKSLNLEPEDGTGEAQPRLRDEDQEKKLQLKLQWELDEQMLGLPEAARPSSSQALTGAINAQALDVEAILNDVTTRHAHLALLALRERLARSVLARGSDTALGPITQAPGSSSMEIGVSQTLRVTLALDHRSGRLSLDPSVSGSGVAGDASPESSLATGMATSSLNKMIKEATRTLNVAPDALIEILIKLRIATIREDIERKAAYVGLHCTRRLQLAQEEYVKLGAQPSQMLFLPLQAFPSFYLTVVVKTERVMVALICPLPMVFGDGSASSSLVIQSLQWLDIDRILTATYSSGKRKRGDMTAARTREIAAGLGRDGKSLPAGDLARLHSYASALTMFSQVESQLRLRTIRYIYIPSEARVALQNSSALAYQRAEDAIPSVTLRSADIFGPTAASLLQQNVVLRVKDYWDAETCSARLVAKLRFNLGLKGAGVGASANGDDSVDADAASAAETQTAVCDLRRSLLIFQSHDVAQAIPVFQFEWHSIAKVMSLARWLAVKASTEAYPARLRRFDLKRVTFSYGPGHTLSCSVQWSVGTPTSPPGYRLSFGSSPAQTSSGSDKEMDVSMQPPPEMQSEKEASPTNPHQAISSYLESLLDASSVRSSTQLPDWRAFISLLNQTLPVLATLHDIRQRASIDDDNASASEDGADLASSAALQPDVEWLSATWYRVIFLERYRLDIRLAKDSKLYLYDADASASSQDDRAAIPGFEAMLAKVARREAASPSSKSLHKPQLSCMALGGALLGDLRALNDGSSAGEKVSRILRSVIDCVQERIVAEEFSPDFAKSNGNTAVAGAEDHNNDQAGRGPVEVKEEAGVHTGGSLSIKQEKDTGI